MTHFFGQSALTDSGTPGERRFAERLREKLGEAHEYHCWYDAPVGPRQRRPDFILLHPAKGLLVLEVKDWSIDSILRMDPKEALLRTPEGEKAVANPLEQARGYVLELSDLLQQDPLLLQNAGPHQGKLVTPYGWGVVLTSISRKDFNARGLDKVMEPRFTICQDEMVPSVAAEAFQERLWGMFPHSFACRLAKRQIRQIRGRIYPDIVVAQKSGAFGQTDPQEAAAKPSTGRPAPLKVMDEEQERVAREMRGGHRVVHGVAGSGKTMILVHRALHLAREAEKPVLVLCYNKALAARLNQLAEARGLSSRLRVSTFLSWCHRLLRDHRLPLPPDGAKDFFDQLAARALKGVEEGRIPDALYSAILIDEGQDFQPDWCRLAVRMTDPRTQNLLVMYDDAQSIYKRLSFTFKSVGIQAVGRSTIMRVNHRNTQEVLAVARGFAADLLTERAGQEDAPPLVAPQSSGRHGSVPVLIDLKSAAEEMSALAAAVQTMARRGRALSEMAVLCATRHQMDQAARALEAVGLETVKSDAPDALFSADPQTVKILTFHASKGLEFPLVFIPFVGSMPARGDRAEEEARLLYVAMTRSTEDLVLLASGASPFVSRLRAAVAACPPPPAEEAA